MSYKIANIRLGIEADEEEIPSTIARSLGLRAEDIAHWRIVRKSLDARDASDLSFVYAAEVNLRDEQATLACGPSKQGIIVSLYEPPVFEFPQPGVQSLQHRPLIIGSGPAGMAAAYFLAQRGYRPLVLERGAPVSERIRDVRAFDEGGEHNPESNYLFGEGGAGTFSDGKLTCRMTGPDVTEVLHFYAEHKGKPSILYDHRPHLGSNRLPAVVKAQRQKVEELGGEIRFHCQVSDVDLSDGKVRGVMTSSGYIAADVVILAIGHSARDTYEMLHRRGVTFEQKPFQFGVRIEHPQENTNRQCYGNRKLEDKLGSASYTVVQKSATGLDLFSFCMCAGGYVMPSVSEPGAFCTNGMSLSKRNSPYANSGLVVTLGSEHFGNTHPLAGMYLQQSFEQQAARLSAGKYQCPIQRAGDYLEKKLSSGQVNSSYPRETLNADLRAVLPTVIAETIQQALPAINKRWQGRFLKEATLVGPEARGSAPVRIPRAQDTRLANGLDGLYPIGEGAGYAGGIISAAVDGLRTAKAVVARYAVPR